jgi:hypothetical protein
MRSVTARCDVGVGRTRDRDRVSSWAGHRAAAKQNNDDVLSRTPAFRILHRQR